MNDKFTPLTGDVTYNGDDTKITSSGNLTLNGKPMVIGEEYTISNGDVIEDLDFNINPSDFKWKFRVN